MPDAFAVGVPDSFDDGVVTADDDVVGEALADVVALCVAGGVEASGVDTPEFCGAGEHAASVAASATDAVMRVRRANTSTPSCGGFERGAGA